MFVAFDKEIRSLGSGIEISRLFLLLLRSLVIGRIGLLYMSCLTALRTAATAAKGELSHYERITLGYFRVS